MMCDAGPRRQPRSRQFVAWFRSRWFSGRRWLSDIARRSGRRSNNKWWTIRTYCAGWWSLCRRRRSNNSRPNMSGENIYISLINVIIYLIRQRNYPPPIPSKLKLYWKKGLKNSRIKLLTSFVTLPLKKHSQFYYFLLLFLCNVLLQHKFYVLIIICL